MYLLDTSTLTELLRTAPPASLIRRISHVPTQDRWTSVITVGQLLIAARLERDPKLMQNVVRMVASIRVAPFDLSAAQSFAKLRAGDASAETDDVMIAAIAISREMTLVTKRRGDFDNFDKLRIEDWTTG
jgi:tRNA(fMet)-specific endonuclease VapC